jgi:putative ABC transport system permease protein
MKIRDIALKNLMRRKGKAGFILAGLAIGVATVVAVNGYVDAMTRSIQEKMEKYGANILIVPKTDSLSLNYGGISLGGVSFEMKEIRQDALEKINGIKNARNIAAMGPMVLGAVSLRNRRILLAGVDFKALGVLKPWWKVRGAMPKPGQILIGAEVARLTGLEKGEAAVIGGYPMTVSGVVQATGSQDDQLIFTGIETAQAMLGKPGRVSLVEVAALCNDCPVDEMVDQISAAMPEAKVMAIQSVVRGRMETLAQFKRFSLGVSIVIAMVGGLVVLVTLMGSVRERRREIGIFRAIGFRRGHVMQIVFLEAGIVSIIAGIIGYGLGIAAASIGVRLLGGEHAGRVFFDPILAGAAIAAALAIGLLASAYPAVMASRLDPNDALKAL